MSSVRAEDDEDVNNNIAEAIEATQAAMDALVDRVEELSDIIEEAEPYGEEPFFDDMTGSEVIETCLENIMQAIEDWLDFHEQLEDLQDILDPNEGTWA